MDFDNVLYEVEDRILTITLNRPEILNAFSGGMLRDIKMGFVFAARGIIPEGCSSWFLPRVVGISKALEWCYSARVFRSEEALEAGLALATSPDAKEGINAFLEKRAPDFPGKVSSDLPDFFLWWKEPEF